MSNKPSRTTFHDRMDYLLTSLRHKIDSGSLEGGDYLPSLNQLSETYKLSKNSVQKALDVLVDESLIERIPRVGIRVLESEERNLTTIRFGYYPSLSKTAYLSELVALFEKDYPHIQVKMIPLQYENYKDVVSHYLMAGMLDVVTINDINFNQLIDEVPDAVHLFESMNINSDIYSFLSPSFTVNKQTYVQPLIFSPVILCYNKEHFNGYEQSVLSGPLKWSEFSTLLERTKNQGSYQYPFYFHPTANNRWPIFLLQSGVGFREDGTLKVEGNVSSLMDGVQACYDLIHTQKLLPMHVSSYDSSVEELFSLEKSSVMITTYFGLNDLIDVDVPFEIAPLPYVEEPRTLLLTVGLALNNFSKQKGASQKFIDYLTSYDSQLQIRRHSLSIPAMGKAAEWDGKEVIKRPENFKLYQDIVSTFSTLSDLNLNQQERIQLLNGLKLYWMGLESKEATTAFVQEIFNINK